MFRLLVENSCLSKYHPRALKNGGNMHYIGKGLLFAAAALLIMGGCVGKDEYLKKQTEVENCRQDATATVEKNRQLQLAAEDLSRKNEELTTLQKKIKSEYGQVVRDKEALATDLQKLHQETDLTIERLLQQNTELAGDKQMLTESITLLRKNKEKEVEKVSGTYEDLLEKMGKEIQQGQIAITELKGKLTVDVVDKILFDSGKAEIKPEGMEVLSRVVDVLATATDKVIRVEGHTDNVPIKGNLARRYPTNWELSSARALTVVRYLEAQGLDPHILSAVAFGEHRPAAPNDTPEGRAKNRRIAIVLQPDE
jgi:chemotaxis protein MotB